MIREIIELFAVNRKFLDDLPLTEVNPFLSEMYQYIEDSHKEIINELTEKKAFNDELTEKLVTAIKEFRKTYELKKGETK
ncbi:MAG: F0F1 ATP synthase subunit alpha, partial [Bacilli bacterium]|nr:F0F1 ATP synthase subunit alpha [Bacilli bacterium]